MFRDRKHTMGPESKRRWSTIFCLPRLAAVRSAPELAHFDLPEFWPQAQEAFEIKQIGKTWVVTGSDSSGVLYGELELADRIRAALALPENIDDMEHPALKLR